MQLGVETRWKRREPEDTKEKGSQISHLDLPNGRDECFVDDSKQWNNVSIFRLGDELCDYAYVVQSALGIRYTHDSVHEVDLPLFSRMIKACWKYGIR
jgi:hypothetical protein